MHDRKFWDRYPIGILGSLCLVTLALATFVKMNRHIMPQGIVRTLVFSVWMVMMSAWAVIAIARGTVGR